MVIGILGASGYVGSVLRELLSPDHEIVLFSRTEIENFKDFEVRLWDPLRKESLNFSGLDLVINCVFDFDVDRTTFVEENIRLAKTIFAAAHSQSATLINISSVVASIPNHSIYGRAKHLIEQASQGSGVIHLRIGVIDDLQNPMLQMVHRMISMLPVKIIPFPNGVVHVTSMGDLYRSIVEFDRSVKPVITVTTHSETIKEFFQKRLANMGMQTIVLPMPEWTWLLPLHFVGSLTSKRSKFSVDAFRSFSKKISV